MAFNMTVFLSKVDENPQGAKGFTKSFSSLKHLIDAFPKNRTVLTPDEKDKIRRIAAFLPYEKRTKYQTALKYLADNLNINVNPVPCKPKMEYVEFKVQLAAYMGTNGQGQKAQVYLWPPSEQPPRGEINIGPRGYMHVHKLTWESSDGRPASLLNVKIREHVKFLADTQAAPFNRFADPDREFYMPEEGSAAWSLEFGSANFDDHSTCTPALICCNPRQAGSLVAEQVYQYCHEPVDNHSWQPIEGAAFLLEKKVRREGNDWVFVFKKTNWAPRNTRRFHFEVEYTIGAAPEYLPASQNDVVGRLAIAKVASIQDFARRVISTG